MFRALFRLLIGFLLAPIVLFLMGAKRFVLVPWGWKKG